MQTIIPTVDQLLSNLREKYAFPENRFIDLTHRNEDILWLLGFLVVQGDVQNVNQLLEFKAQGIITIDLNSNIISERGQTAIGIAIHQLAQLLVCRPKDPHETEANKNVRLNQYLDPNNDRKILAYKLIIRSLQTRGANLDPSVSRQLERLELGRDAFKQLHTLGVQRIQQNDADGCERINTRVASRSTSTAAYSMTLDILSPAIKKKSDLTNKCCSFLKRCISSLSIFFHHKEGRCTSFAMATFLTLRAILERKSHLTNHHVYFSGVFLNGSFTRERQHGGGTNILENLTIIGGSDFLNPHKNLENIDLPGMDPKSTPSHLKINRRLFFVSQDNIPWQNQLIQSDPNAVVVDFFDGRVEPLSDYYEHVFEIIGPCAIDHTTRENPDPETFEHYRQGPHPFCNGDILAIAPQEESLLLQECQGFSQLLEKMLKQEALANKDQEKAPSAAPSKRH
ncbi:MAG: hypothetical protein A2X77_05125 [Gammaproteobacteria bacterium GWE2_42_36]|nr:MAG: hypothetical protein A2X77_05125 [Gammaproteobacteria bacterium GWE2_42_36]HCU05666.1 hypothetical protein [Coxiellaceae bacterium]